MPTHIWIVPLAWLLATVAVAQDSSAPGSPWQRHTIDDSARGADGVRLADVNGDGHLDIATGWEEAGIVRIYVNPGPPKAKEAWPAVTVAQVKSPEDAVLVDLDGDGRLEIVSCCEGSTKSVFVHWNTDKPDAQARESSIILRDSDLWPTQPFPALAGKRLAMFCLPMQIDGENGIDLVIGSKGKEADVGWLRSPKDPRNLAAWTWHPLTKAGWIMSLVACDMDGDGDDDVLVSDRKRESRGVYWLERPEPKDATGPWPLHLIRGVEGQVMFLDVAGTPRVPSAAEDGTRSVPTTELVIPTHDNRLWLAYGKDGSGDAWDLKEFPWPANIGNGKSAAFADIDLDGQRDIVISCETREEVSGIVWLPGNKTGQVEILPHDISGIAGPKGLKFDRVELIDLDADGDQDVLTTEERSLWGVVWFENPAK